MNTDDFTEAAAEAANERYETEETARMDDIDDAWGHARAALFAARAARTARRTDPTRKKA